MSDDGNNSRLRWKWRFVSAKPDDPWHEHVVPFEWDALNSLNNEQAAIRVIRAWCDGEMRGTPVLIENVRVLSLTFDLDQADRTPAMKRERVH